MACKQLRHACLWLLLKDRACLDHPIPVPPADTIARSRQRTVKVTKAMLPTVGIRWSSGVQQSCCREGCCYTKLLCWHLRAAHFSAPRAERRRSGQRCAAGHCTRRGWTWSSCCTAWEHSPNRWLILRECILTTPSRSCPTKRSAKGPSGVMMVSARHGCPHRVTCCRQGLPEVGAALKRPS